MFDDTTAFSGYDNIVNNGCIKLNYTIITHFLYLSLRPIGCKFGTVSQISLLEAASKAAGVMTQFVARPYCGTGEPDGAG